MAVSSAQLASEVVACAAASAAAGAECCVEVDAEGDAEQSAGQSVTALGMFELLRSVQQQCDEQGLGPEVAMLLAEP